MLKFAWRWARVGDAVLVHDRRAPHKGLQPGTVAFNERVEGITRLGVRIAENGSYRIVWPAQACVHPDPLDVNESCTTCLEAAAESTV